MEKLTFHLCCADQRLWKSLSEAEQAAQLRKMENAAQWALTRFASSNRLPGVIKK